jgi:hypothetical protein
MPKSGSTLSFASTVFVVEAGEDEKTNPGVFGKAFAHWLVGQLRARGVPAGAVIPEDFAWCIRVGSASDKLYIACGSAFDEPVRWKAFVFSDRGAISRLFSAGAKPEAIDSLYATMKAILAAAPEVSDLEEETD